MIGGCQGTVQDHGTAARWLARVQTIASLPSHHHSHKVSQLANCTCLIPPPDRLNNCRPDGSVAQFYSDLSMLEPQGSGSPQVLSAPGLSASEGTSASGRELQRKTISVNDPFRYGGITMYQVG